MRDLDELLSNDPAWPMVQELISAATNHVEVLPPDQNTRGEALVQTQVSTRSPMGAVIYETGGILVDHQWLRILGSGHPRLPRSLPAWNERLDQPGLWFVADDVLGGFFAINGGALPSAPGSMSRFSPDTRKWADLEMGYSDLLAWCLEGDLAKFYADQRWPGWVSDVARVGGDGGFMVYPFLSAEGPRIAERTRTEVPIHELYSTYGASPLDA